MFQLFSTPIKRKDSSGSEEASPKKKPAFENTSVNDVAKLFEKSATEGMKALCKAKVEAVKKGELILKLYHVPGFTALGAKFTPVAVKICERKRANSVVDCWYTSNHDSEYCIVQHVAMFHENEIGPIWMQKGMKMLKSTPQRKTPFGEVDAPLLRKGQYEVTFLFTYIKCDCTTDGTIARIKEFGEFIKLALTRTEIQGGRSVVSFVETYKATVSPNLYNSVPPNFQDKLIDMSVEVDQITSMDALYCDAQIYNGLRYAFQTSDLSGEENTPKVALGWIKTTGHF